MAGSLKDQLFKAGLASKKQVKNVELDQRKQSKQGKKARQSASSQAESIDTARQQKIEKDRALNEARQQQQLQRAAQAEIRQLVEQHRIALPKDGDVRYQFLNQGKVKQIWINTDIQKQLANRSLSLVWVNERFELVPSNIGDRIVLRDPDAVIKEDTERRDKIAAEEAAYADFEIPDDLDW